MSASSNALLRTVPPDAAVVSLLAVFTGLFVVWGSEQAVLLLAASSAGLGLAWLCMRSVRQWAYVCVATSVIVPPFYPAALSGATPIYVCNFMVAGGCILLLWKIREFRLPADAIGSAALYFLLSLLLSLSFALWVSGPSEALQSLLRFVLILQPFFVYFWIRGFGCLEGQDQLLRFVKFLLWIGVLGAIYGVVDFYYPIPIPHPFADQFIYLDFKHIRRAQGLFYEASSFGNFCAFFLCLAICVLFSRSPRLSLVFRGLAFLASGVFTMAVFLSYSRGSWLAVMVTLAVFLARQGRFRLRIAVLMTVIFGCFLFLVYQFSPDVVANFFTWRLANLAEFWDDPNTATSGRWENWTTLVSFFADRPWLLLFGIGYKTIPTTEIFGRSVIADNGYMSLLFETGVLGLAAFFWLNLAILKTLGRGTSQASPFHRLCQSFLLAFWCGEMVQMLTGDIFTYWRNLTVFFALISATASEAQSSSAQEQS